jgi:hypothetical protein
MHQAFQNNHEMDDNEDATRSMAEYMLDYDSIGKPISNIPKRFLHDGYKLSDYDVYCGRGYLCFNHIGNHHFRTLISNNIHRYTNAVTKFQKSLIIQEIVDHVRNTSKEGGFVKKDTITGRYYEVGDYHAVSFVSFRFFFCISHN